MAIDKNKVIKGKAITTGEGVALYCNINRPDVFDESKHVTKIILSKEDGEDFLAKLETFSEEARQTMLNNKNISAKDKKQLVNVPVPYEMNTDKEGNETDQYVFKAKTGVQYPPVIVNADGEKYTGKDLKELDVKNGGTIQINVTPKFVHTKFLVGVTLVLNAVKVISDCWKPAAESIDFGFEVKEKAKPEVVEVDAAEELSVDEMFGETEGDF